jgi:hypothetical protein
MIDFYDAEFHFPLDLQVYRNLPGHERPRPPARRMKRQVRAAGWMSTAEVIFTPDFFRIRVCPQKLLGSWNSWGTEDLREYVSLTAPLVLQELGHRVTDDQEASIAAGEYRLSEVHITRAFHLVNYSQQEFIRRLFYAIAESHRPHWAKRGEGIVINGDNRRVSAYPKLAARLTRLLGGCSGFDSVQLWRDLDAKADVPFVLFSERQLAALIKKVRTPEAHAREATSVADRLLRGAVPVVVRATPEIASNGGASTLAIKLLRVIVRDISELGSCSGIAFQRTRTKAPDRPKWLAKLQVGDKSLVVGSLTPARDLVKTRKRLRIVESRQGVKLIGETGDELSSVVTKLQELGLYSDDMRHALDRAVASTQSREGGVETPYPPSGT